MAVFKVNKTENFTVMSNHHLRNKDLSLKAKGMMSLMLSLPPEWDYSMNGLVAISKEGIRVIKSTLTELQESGYLKIDKLQDEKGHFYYEYNIFEHPDIQNGIVDHPGVHFPPMDKPPMDNVVQLNTNKLNTNKLNTNNIYKEAEPKKATKKKFTPPTLAEVYEYCQERQNDVDPKKFYDYYNASNWEDAKGNKVRNWKQKVITWEGRQNARNQKHSNLSGINQKSSRDGSEYAMYD